MKIAINSKVIIIYRTSQKNTQYWYGKDQVFVKVIISKNKWVETDLFLSYMVKNV